jgi:hypothetical protein
MLPNTAKSDFSAGVPCNDPNQKRISERLRARLTAAVSRRRRGRPKGSKNKIKKVRPPDASPHRYLAEIHRLNSGHFAVEDSLTYITEKMKAFYGKT